MRILTIAGSDSGGGAGIQIDIKTAQRIGCDSSTVITAVTAQNSHQVFAVEQLPLQLIESQFRAVMDDIKIDAIKIGMLGDAATAKLIGRLLGEYQPRYVVADPVLVATSGGILGREGTSEAILEYIVPQCTLLTPNIDEAEALCSMCGVKIDSPQRGEEAWNYFKKLGLKALLLKGGHAAQWQGSDIVDTLYTGDGIVEFKSGRIDIAEHLTHGTGCTLSAAIASYLALGATLQEATGSGINFVQHRLRTIKE